MSPNSDEKPAANNNTYDKAVVIHVQDQILSHYCKPNQGNISPTYKHTHSFSVLPWSESVSIYYKKLNWYQLYLLIYSFKWKSAFDTSCSLYSKSPIILILSVIILSPKHLVPMWQLEL